MAILRSTLIILTFITLILSPFFYQRRAKVVVKRKNNSMTQENFSFPSVGSITAPILGPIDEIVDTVKTVEHDAEDIVTSIDNGIKLLANFPSCFPWYSLQILGNIVYAPFAFFFWLFGLESIENSIWSFLDQIDSAFYEATNFHIFHYSDAIQSKCYFTKTKAQTKKSKMPTMMQFPSMQMSSSTSFGIVVIVFFATLFLGFCIYYAIYISPSV